MIYNISYSLCGKKQLLALTSLFLLTISSSVYGQHESNLTYGVKFGALHSTISNLPESIKGRDQTFTDNYYSSKGKYGVEGGLFLNYKLPNSRTAIQPELLIRTAGEKIQYNDPQGLQKEIGFDYTYLSLGALYKIYPYEGLNLGVGAFYSINLSPHAVSYQSNEADGLYDVTTRQFYREGFSGGDDFSLSFSLGYELRQSIHFDLRYSLGVKDVIKSYSNSFQFVENENRTGIISFTIGYSFHKW